MSAAPATSGAHAPTAAHLAVEGLGLWFGGLKALTDVSFEVKPGTITALIGPNRAGKTSLFNCISGFYRPRAGAIRLDGADITQTHPRSGRRRGWPAPSRTSRSSRA